MLASLTVVVPDSLACRWLSLTSFTLTSDQTTVAPTAVVALILAAGAKSNYSAEADAAGRQRSWG